MVEIIFSVLGVCCAAVYIWLLVRFLNGKKKSSIRIGLAVTIALPVLYSLSFGPACWIAARADFVEHEKPLRSMTHVYQPLILTLFSCPKWLQDGVAWYLGLAVPAGMEPYFYDDGRNRGLMWNGPGYTYTVLSTRYR